MSKFLQLDIYNDTNDNLPLSFTVNRTEDIINNENRNLSIGISRFFIPSDLITPYSTVSSNILGSYKIGMHVKELNGVSNKYFVSNLDKSSSIVDIMNSCNYALIAGYYNMIRSMGNSPSSGNVDYSYVRQLYSKDFGNTINYTFSGSPNDSTGQARLSTTIATISLTDGSGHDIYGIKLNINKFYNVTMYGDYPIGGLELNLVAPSGKKCNIFTNQFNMNNTLNPATRNWNFADYYTEAVNINSDGNYYPREMFSKLYGEEAGGNWSLELAMNKLPTSTDTALNIRIEGTIEIMCRKTDNSTAYHTIAPRLPPFVNLDTSDKITFNYSEKLALTGFRLLLSKSLNAVLKLPAKNIVLDNTNYDLVELPSISCENSTPNEFNTLVVNQTYASNNTPKIATDIYKLVFKTTLPITPTIIANSARASENILTDYIVEQYDNEYYTFSWDYPNRVFDLITTTHINNFTLQAYIERLDGSQELIYIMPNKRANILLMIKNNTF
jgi:hypothetical protein